MYWMTRMARGFAETILFILFILFILSHPLDLVHPVLRFGWSEEAGRRCEGLGDLSRSREKAGARGSCR